jgi:GT2 family glycosyltransferase
MTSEGMISVVFSVAGKYDLLRKAIESMPAALDGEPCEVFVVDSGYPGDPTDTSEGRGRPTDRDRAWALDAPVPLHWIDYLDKPHNLHRQWNLGLERARGDVLCYFNDDVEFAPLCLSKCAKAIRSGAVEACYPRCFNHDHERHLFDAAAANVGGAWGIVGPAWGGYHGYALVMSRDTWETVGPFDEQFNWGRGDFDYHCRLQIHKRFAREVEGAYLFHHGQATLRWYGGEYWTRARDADKINSAAKWDKDNSAHAHGKRCASRYALDAYAAQINGYDDLCYWIAHEVRSMGCWACEEYDPELHAKLRARTDQRVWCPEKLGLVVVPGRHYPQRPVRDISLKQFMIRFAPREA